MVEYRKITPVDVLFLRGNRLFGGAGEHGESQMPPWPSVFFGAMASRILADKGKIADITKSPDKARAILNEVVGENYGCTFLSLAQKGKTYLPLPYDLVAFHNEGVTSLHPVNPCPLPEELRSSNTLPMVPILKTPERKKPAGGIWLDLGGWRRHLAGETVNNSFCISQGELWKVDSRLGIARDYGSKTAAEGKIYTTEGVVMKEDSGFLVGFDGFNIPRDGLLRLGGDGRGAVIEPCSDVEIPGDLGKPEDDWAGFRMILITPGIFAKGWLPPGCKKEDGKVFLHFNGLKAELKAIAMRRHGVISGWDLANHEPKPARKVVPGGSVYWFECIEGNPSSLEPIWRDSLYVTLGNGIDTEFETRKREGFGRVWFGKWDKEKEG